MAFNGLLAALVVCLRNGATRGPEFFANGWKDSKAAAEEEGHIYVWQTTRLATPGSFAAALH